MNSLFTRDKLLDDIIFSNKNVYILALKENKEYILVKGNYKMLYNKLYKNNAYIIEKKFIEQYNYNNFKLDDIEIIIPKLNILHTDLKDYLELFQEKTLEDLIKLYILLDYYNNENNPIIYNKLNSFISQLEFSNYWCNPKKCKLNITKQFIERTFKLNFDKGEISDDIKKVLDNIDINYKYDYSDIFNNFLDISNGFNKDYGFYKIYENEIDITKEQINELFSNLKSEYLKYTFFNRIALSIKYTHLVVNNEYILDLMKDIFKKFLPIYKYIFGYIWLYYSIEEKIKKNNLSISDRNIFSRDTASKLPNFPVYFNDIHMNPYISTCISKNSLDNNNLFGLGYISNHDYSIATQKEFQENFNIFTTGYKDKNIFSDLNWNNIEVSGSLMLACSLKEHPLLYNFKYIDDITLRKKRMYDEYYCSADIDISCDCKSTFDYIDKFKEIYNCVKKNLEKIHKKEIILNKTINKRISIIVNKKNITEYLPLYSLNELENKNNKEIKEIFYNLYIKNKIERNSFYRKSKNEDDYEEFYKIVDIDSIKISFKDDIKEYDDKEITYNITNNNNIYIKIIEIIKYKIESPNLKHQIEFFNIFNKNNISCINRFHLGCVRSNINHMTTSSITSYKTGINMDYYYFNGMIDTMDILIKYLIRGQGCLLNNIEKNCLIQYIRNTKWNNYFSINNNNIKNIFNYKKLNSSIFKPRRFLDEYKKYSDVNDIYSVDDYKYIDTFSDFEDEYKRICGYDNKNSKLKLLNYKTINDNGYINPLNWNLIEMAYHELKN